MAIHFFNGNLHSLTSSALLCALLLMFAGNTHAVDAPQSDGVKVGKPSILRNLVPAKQLEQQASLQYEGMMGQAASQHALAPDNHP